MAATCVQFVLTDPPETFPIPLISQKYWLFLWCVSTQDLLEGKSHCEMISLVVPSAPVSFFTHADTVMADQVSKPNGAEGTST